MINNHLLLGGLVGFNIDEEDLLANDDDVGGDYGNLGEWQDNNGDDGEEEEENEIEGITSAVNNAWPDPTATTKSNPAPWINTQISQISQTSTSTASSNPGSGSSSPCSVCQCSHQIFDSDIGSLVCTNCGAIAEPDSLRLEHSSGNFDDGYRTNMATGAACRGGGSSGGGTTLLSIDHATRSLIHLQNLAKSAEHTLKLPGSSETLVNMFLEARIKLQCGENPINIPYTGAKANAAFAACVLLLAHDRGTEITLDVVAQFIACTCTKMILKMYQKIRLVLKMKQRVSVVRPKQLIGLGIKAALKEVKDSVQSGLTVESVTSETSKIVQLVTARGLMEGKTSAPLAAAAVTVAIESLTRSRLPVAVLEKVLASLSCSLSATRKRHRDICMFLYQEGIKMVWLKDVLIKKSRKAKANTPSGRESSPPDSVDTCPYDHAGFFKRIHDIVDTLWQMSQKQQASSPTLYL